MRSDIPNIYVSRASGSHFLVHCGAAATLKGIQVCPPKRE